MRFLENFSENLIFLLTPGEDPDKFFPSRAKRNFRLTTQTTLNKIHLSRERKGGSHGIL